MTYTVVFSQAAADDLLAQQLRAKSPHTNNMGHGIGIPALSKHAHADHATNMLTELARSAYSIDHFAQ